MITYQSIDSPVGALLLASAADGLRLIEFEHPWHPYKRGADWREGDDEVLQRTRNQLDDYFAGRLREFDLPLAPHGTPFQLQCWRTLAQIPWGETWSYAQMAQRIGRPTATRAVGAANGRNPLPIVLPCHRVIGSDGSLTGFGGGLPTKQFLLTLEGALPAVEAVPIGDLFAPR
ncbi:methylated-DNA--[protein]-cysteine S-methyltransferase [Lysobacter sp. BMK333-48F3]|uniref:methylated-DNA--[protein]-cysteine S-methyltransferase n=1 Tax=Lysobacter sp. BMK333-48F3 TaxID=2867962 RepID=UPI001C8CC919|nr:methylated-DNA--[protein]-cysteine S-methyltransferase [Lysobacter sp. BMK333-48F3]MBX9402134.1 methylated-DNA--[protein]-cysteine S-methyltransferase [Lysobacter sp. BMK333-48F3]